MLQFFSFKKVKNAVWCKEIFVLLDGVILRINNIFEKIMKVGNHVLRKKMLIFLIYSDKMFFTFHTNENHDMLSK